MGDSFRTTVISVAYNSAAVLPAMLETARGAAAIVVVDNGSEDNSAELATAHGAAVLRFDRNEGFGRRCNVGARAASTEFLFFINPDVRLSSGCIAALEAAADEMKDMVAANPLVLRANGRPDFKTRSILVPGSRSRRRDVPRTRFPMQVLTGCALFCRRDAFEAVGGFDPAMFLYHEDHDLALRLSRAGGTLWHVPDAVVQHEAGTGSARTDVVARLKGYHMARSRYYTMKKHGLALPFLRTWLPAVFGLVQPHNIFSRRRRSKYLGQVRGASSVLIDGGRYVPLAGETHTAPNDAAVEASSAS